MKKFFIKDLANMVEKEIATEFLLRNVKLSIADGRRWHQEISYNLLYLKKIFQ